MQLIMDNLHILNINQLYSEQHNIPEPLPLTQSFCFICNREEIREEDREKSLCVG